MKEGIKMIKIFKGISCSTNKEVEGTIRQINGDLILINTQRGFHWCEANTLTLVREV